MAVSYGTTPANLYDEDKEMPRMWRMSLNVIVFQAGMRTISGMKHGPIPTGRLF